MQSLLIILPDFLIILLGALLAQRFGFGAAFWKPAEKLVFYVLFPPLLFNSIAGAKMTIAGAAPFLAAGVGAMLIAVLIAGLLMKVLHDDPVTHASVFQCGFRFNTYIGFAVCLRLFGDEGFALLALLIAFWVPISNTIAVGVLADAVARRDHGAEAPGGRLRATLRKVLANPLIIATVAGLLAKACGIAIPKSAETLFAHLGNASLAMGLLCIGAGLRLHAFKDHLPLITASTLCRLLVVPAVACGVAALAGLGPVEAGVAILFAALPTAQSCYVMTASMKGDAASVANVTTAQTLAAMATLPFWISAVLIGLSPLAR